MCHCAFFFFKQKTAYEMRISDWSSDVCSSDLGKSHSTRRRSDMKKSVTFALGLALTAGLAACGQQGETSKPAVDAAAPAKAVGAMATLAEPRHGKGTGSVTAIDPAAGEVTPDHGAIAALRTEEHTAELQ